MTQVIFGLDSLYKELYGQDKVSLNIVLDTLDNSNLTLSDEFESPFGFNYSSGNVFACLGGSNEGIILISSFGQSPSYLVTNYDNGEEFEFETIEEAKEKLEELIK